MVAANPESAWKMRVPKKCMLELCPRWFWERVAGLPRVQNSGFVAWQQGGGAREHAPDSRVQAQWDELAEERSACTCRLVCAFILEFP